MGGRYWVVLYRADGDRQFTRFYEADDTQSAMQQAQAEYPGCPVIACGLQRRAQDTKI